MSGETDPIPGGSAISRFLLDTNILIHYVRDDEVKNRVEKQYALLMTPTVPLISAVVEGEIRSLAM